MGNEKDKGRISPHSIEAEEAVLGCMLINKAAVSCPNCGAPQDNSAPAQTTAPSPPAQPASVNVNVNQNTNQNTDIDNPKGQSQRVILGSGEKHCSSCGSVVKIVAEIFDLSVNSKFILVRISLSFAIFLSDTSSKTKLFKK